MKKKPASLSDSLLAHRPRKGEARPQSEEQAALATHRETLATWRRRRGARSPNTVQINIKVSPAIADRFIGIADQENVIFPDALALLIEAYEREAKRKI